MPPFIIIIVAFALGIGLSQFSESGSWVPAAFAAAFFLLVGGVWAYLQGKRYSFLWLPLCFLCLGYAWMGSDRITFPQQLNPLLGHYVKVEGIVDGLPSAYPNRFVFVLDQPTVTLNKEKWQGNGKIQIVYYTTEGSKGTPAMALLPGTVIRVEGFLDLVPAALSPGEFDYRVYLERRGIIAQIKAEGSPEIMSQGKGFSSFWAALRMRIEGNINLSLPREQSLFLQGLLLGSKEGMTPEDRDIYQKTGVMHLFAVSGQIGRAHV